MQTVKNILQKWNSISLVKRIICGLIIGIILGLTVPQATGISILGDLFVGALRGIAPVLVFFLVMSALCHMGKGQKTNMKMIVILYMAGNVLAAACAVIASHIFPIVLTFTDNTDTSDVAPPSGVTEVLTNLLMNLVDNPVNAIVQANYIGILFWAIVKFAGARHVVVTDFNQYRLDLAKKLGATRTVNLGEEKLPDVMKEIGMTEGFDVGLEMSGSQAGLHDMIHNMKHGGKIALLGLQRTDATVDLETVIFNGLNLRGIYGRKVWDTWYKMSMMIQAGLDISEVITHHFDIKDFAKGFEAMISGESGKVILDWSHVND